ncbi:uroporphyrinogen decarboxylase family protein [Paraclostridium tenue]|uniref:Methylcobamide--CoM methyltransferase n=1 Tax=Paraclostridium tenue TaxID=1737 RepID=A0ABN1M8L0_9FIRM
MEMNFICNQNDNENIPIALIKALDIKFPDFHTNKYDIAYISKGLKKYKNDSICKVPFCTTVEAEAFGGIINLGDLKSTPRVKSYAYNSLDELFNIKNIDFNKGRINEVLEAVSILNNEGEVVALNVCGPITIISLLIDLKYFYKGIRKNKNQINDFMKLIEDNIVNYIIKGYENGAKIISYSDPVGDVNIVGPKVYENIVSVTTLNIINRVSNKLDDCIIHLCGKTSTALYNIGAYDFNKIKYNNKITYGQAICNLLDTKGVKIIGNNCMKKTPCKVKESIIYSINLSNI